MKRILLLSFIALTGFTFSASAQQDTTIKKTPDQKLENQLKHLKKQLNLTDQQAISVDSINRIFLTKTTETRKNGGARLDKMKTLKQAMDDRNAAMKTVLSANQFATYEKMQQEQKEKLKDRRTNRKIS